jgi:hypothetical protein
MHRLHGWRPSQRSFRRLQLAQACGQRRRSDGFTLEEGILEGRRGRGPRFDDAVGCENAVYIVFPHFSATRAIVEDEEKKIIVQQAQGRLLLRNKIVEGAASSVVRPSGPAETDPVPSPLPPILAGISGHSFSGNRAPDLTKWVIAPTPLVVELPFEQGHGNGLMGDRPTDQEMARLLQHGLRL